MVSESQCDIFLIVFHDVMTWHLPIFVVACAPRKRPCSNARLPRVALLVSDTISLRGMWHLAFSRDEYPCRHNGLNLAYTKAIAMFRELRMNPQVNQAINARIRDPAVQQQYAEQLTQLSGRIFDAPDDFNQQAYALAAEARGVTSHLVTDMCMYSHAIVGVSPHEYGRAMVGYICPTHTVSVTYKLGVTA
jgi:hypothetical protein